MKNKFTEKMKAEKKECNKNYMVIDKESLKLKDQLLQINKEHKALVQDLKKSYLKYDKQVSKHAQNEIVNE